ncbi:MAG: radical SAM protein [Gammaproteobacteria bacterium]
MRYASAVSVPNTEMNPGPGADWPDIRASLQRGDVKLLLINPRSPESFWSFRWAVEKILPGKRTLNPPLGLATLAALCPADWQVAIIDENVEAVPLNPEADIIGICGMAVQFQRQRELLDYYRKQGFYVVAGGSFASLCPERYEGVVHTVIAGEAENIWLQFCKDFQHNIPKRLYQETGVVNLEDSPVPRFDLLKLDQYTTISMQFSRGCPYRCDFCDIIVMFGRRPRTKNLIQIGRELDLLRSQNIHSVFFVDDNLIGNKKLAKQLLRYLANYQQTHNYTFRFGTQASLNLAEDKELLQLFRAANFAWVFIGIESPDEQSLKEANKTQNLRQDILSAVRAIYTYGIDVLGGFIVGFDNDTLETFERQYRFITASGVQVAMVGLLTALPRTPLYKRLEQEGRLITGAEAVDNTKPGTNFMPKRMAYDAMVREYKTLYTRLFSDGGIAQRIRNKTRYLKRPIYQGEYSLSEGLSLLGKFIARGLLPGGPLRVYRFLYTLATSSARAWPLVITDWIAGLAMRDYIKHHFGLNRLGEQDLVQTTAAFVRRLCATSVHRGGLEVFARSEDGAANLLLALRGYVDRTFYTRAPRRLVKLMRRSAASITLCIDELCEDQRDALDQLLQRLAPYGDRVSIWVSERVRPRFSVDSSVFHLLLGERPKLSKASC